MSWPLSAVLRRDGGVRFVTAPVVRADARDFPGQWTPTRVDAVGNDDVDGLLALQVGRAYVALVGRYPFRGDIEDEIALPLGLQALLRGATPAAFDTLHADAVADAARAMPPRRDVASAPTSWPGYATTTRSEATGSATRISWAL